MKKYSFILAAAAVSMLVACNKEQDMPVSKNLPQEAQLVRTPAMDNTHLTRPGAQIVAGMVADKIKEFGLWE